MFFERESNGNFVPNYQASMKDNVKVGLYYKYYLCFIQ